MERESGQTRIFHDKKFFSETKLVIVALTAYNTQSSYSDSQKRPQGVWRKEFP